jgi:hypothetical protein
MPYFFDATTIVWPDDDDNFEAPDPKLADFVYLPAPEFSGKPPPVRFTVPSAPPDADPAIASPASDTPAKPRSGLLSWIFGSRVEAGKADAQDWARDHDRRSKVMQAITIPALREIGVATAYCRYDGGNDEGFAWFDHVTLKDGRRLDAEALVDRLVAAGVGRKLVAAKITIGGPARSDEEQVRDVINYWLANEWVSLLLGGGFGTGEYSMYGACTVDLETGLITDDPKAEPIVQNIVIDKTAKN